MTEDQLAERLTVLEQQITVLQHTLGAQFEMFNVKLNAIAVWQQECNDLVRQAAAKLEEFKNSPLFTMLGG